MASKKQGLGSVKRLGTRYGRTTKYKLAKIEQEQKTLQVCPYCSKQKVTRVSFGIWNCEKCSSKFTARAYSVGKKVSIEERAAQLVAEAPEIKSREAQEE